MISNINIAFIGPGAMAEAMLSGILRKKLTKPENILASGPFVERVEELKKKYGTQPFTNNREAAAKADVVILSVKPQRLEKVLLDLKGSLKSDALVLSIVAGATMAKIERLLDHDIIVRSMPNTPAQIGEGITVWTCTDTVSEKQKQFAQTILGAFGTGNFRRGGRLSRQSHRTFGNRTGPMCTCSWKPW